MNERLDEQELADKFGVSRTPVREALRQLAAAGLVQIRPRRGAVVVPADPIKMGEAFEAAAELESLIAGWAAMRGTLLDKIELKKRLEKCDVALDTNDAKAYAASNRKLHDKIAELAKNESLNEATKMVRVRTAPFLRLQFQSAEERRQSHLEHAEIVEAVCRQDVERAKSAMKEHLLRSSLSALRILTEKWEQKDEQNSN